MPYHAKISRVHAGMIAAISGGSVVVLLVLLHLIRRRCRRAKRAQPTIAEFEPNSKGSAVPGKTTV